MYELQLSICFLPVDGMLARHVQVCEGDGAVSAADGEAAQSSTGMRRHDDPYVFAGVEHAQLRLRRPCRCCCRLNQRRVAEPDALRRLAGRSLGHRSGGLDGDRRQPEGEAISLQGASACTSGTRRRFSPPSPRGCEQRRARGRRLRSNALLVGTHSRRSGRPYCSACLTLPGLVSRHIAGSCVQLGLCIAEIVPGCDRLAVRLVGGVAQLKKRRIHDRFLRPEVAQRLCLERLRLQQGLRQVLGLHRLASLRLRPIRRDRASPHQPCVCRRRQRRRRRSCLQRPKSGREGGLRHVQGAVAQQLSGRNVVGT
mmetsp:Transcript_92473/g.258476  ORF Transcript_92473/g.258476 Transcript_92473/m.258476 type:complete len:312 (+) Transcript_92473:700-1635(+)